MKYKLLQNAPNAKKGDIFDIDASSRFEFYTNGNGSYHKDEVENNPDWFGKYILTTEDKVDIYNEKGTIAALVLKNYNENSIKKNDIIDIVIEPTIAYWNKDTWKFFSTKQAAEKYLEPKLKINDYIVYDNEVHQIDNIKISSFISNEKSYDKALCRKANNSEIISYYEKLGWVKGAEFQILKNNIVIWDSQTIQRLVSEEGNVYIYVDWNVNRILLDNCKLIKEPNYPKSWEDLKPKGYVFNNGGCNVIPTSNFEEKLMSQEIFRTEKQALSSLAFAQLSQLVAEMNDNWQPNWNDHNQCKYVIDREFDTIYKRTTTVIFHPLAFKSKEARDFSFQHHGKLWCQYNQL